MSDTIYFIVYYYINTKITSEIQIMGYLCELSNENKYMYLFTRSTA